jgi:hypothetical protein
VAWTTPATAVAGSTALTAAFWNTNVRDQFNSMGLVHILTESFTTAATVSVNNCFSDMFQNYKVVIQHTSSVGGLGTSYSIRLRVGGTDNTTASSYVRERSLSAAGVQSNSGSTGDSFSTVIIASATRCVADITFARPFEAAPTGFVMSSSRSNALTLAGGEHNQSTSYDGFSIIPSSGTTTGTIRVYGYLNG